MGRLCVRDFLRVIGVFCYCLGDSELRGIGSGFVGDLRIFWR